MYWLVLVCTSLVLLAHVQQVAGNIPCNSYTPPRFVPVCPFDCSNCGGVSCNNDYMCVGGYCATANGPAGPHGCAFEDIARGKPMAQISTHDKLGPYRAANRYYATNVYTRCTHTLGLNLYPWWRVDFGSPHVVYAVQLYNRIANPALDRLSFFDIRVGDTDIQTSTIDGHKFNGNTLCKKYKQRVPETLSDSIKPYAEIMCDQPVRGRYLSIQMNEGAGISRSQGYTNVLTICEINIRGYRDFGSGGRNGDGDRWCRDTNERGMAGVCESGCKIGRYGKYCHRDIHLETPTLYAYSPTSVNVQWKLFNSNQLTFIDSNRGPVDLSYRVQYKPVSGTTWQDFTGQSSVSGSGATQVRVLKLTELQADTKYHIGYALMKTYNGNAEVAAYSSVVTRCAVPPPVTNIELTTGCDGADKASITVTWQASSYVRCGNGNVQYVVWVKEGPAGSGAFGSHGLQNSGYVIRNLKQATVYTVRVEARNSAHHGLKSLTDQTLTTLDGVPSAPEDVQLSTSFSTDTSTWPNQARISVNWKRPANAGCGHVRYRVTYSGLGATETDMNIPSTSHTLLDLVPYTLYEVTVTIVSGEKTADAEKKTIRTAEGQSSPVTNIRFSATTTTTTTVSWTKPDNPHGLITKYDVTYIRTKYLVSGPTTVNCPAGSGQAETVTVNSGTSVQLTGLKSKAQYNIAVVPYTAGGHRAGIQSNVIVNTLSAELPKPRQIRATQQYDPNLAHPNQCKSTVTWEADIGTDCMVLQFRVDYKPTTSQTTKRSARLAGATRSSIISSLKCYTDYEVRVVALRGNVEESATYKFKTAEGKPGRVSSLTITPSSNSAVLRWSAPTPHGVLSQYEIAYRRVRYLAGCPSTDQTKTRTVAAATTAYTVTGLTSYSEYQFSVTAYTNNNGNKGPTEWQTKQTTKKAPPRPSITDIQSQYEPTFPYPNTVRTTVTWSQPAADVGECMTVTNHVHYRRSGTSQSAVVTRVTSSPFEIPRLVPYTYYDVRAEARSEQGLSSFTEWKRHLTAEGLSGPVTSLSVSPSDTTVDVSWTAPAHLYGRITSYRVSYSRRSYLANCYNHPGHTHVVDTTDMSHTFTSLSPYSEYRVKVVPINGAGRGMEDVKDVTIPDAAPNPSSVPANATVSHIANTSATVQFYDISCKQRRGSFAAFNYQLTDLSYGLSSRSGDVTTVQLQLTDLTPFTNYDIRYNWANQKGASAWSTETRFQTTKSTPPAPTITTVDSGPRYINVTVQPPYPPYDDLTSVTVTCRRTDNNQNIANQMTIMDNSNGSVVVSFDEVEPSTNYSCSASVTGSLTSTSSEEETVTTTESEASEPRQFKAAEITTTSMRLTWISPRAKNGLISKYHYGCKAKHTKNPSVIDSLSGAAKLEFTLVYKYSNTDSDLPHTTDTITDLWSATQYECQVSAFNGAGYGKVQSRTFWTKAEPIILPDGSQVNYDPAQSNDSSVHVMLPRITSSNVKIELYQILVKRLPQNEGSNRKKRSGDPVPTPEDFGGDNYTAAQWNDSRDSFLVGDGQYYGDYYNAPLVKGETYNILFRAASVVGEEVEYTEYISLPAPVRVGHYPPPFPGGLVAGSVVGAIIVILIVTAVIFALVMMSRKGMLPSLPPRARSDSNANIIDGTELNPVVVVEDKDNVDCPVPNGEATTSSKPLVAVPRYERQFQPYSLEGLMATIRGLSQQPRGFTQEYQTLPSYSGRYPQSVAQIQENKKKNRYQDIIPYDHNRVVLRGDEIDDDISNYINASYVTDYGGRRAYIASQGPKTGITVDDFWQMIWQEDIHVIVMATDCYELGREKCAQYWPADVGASLIYGDYEVEHQSTIEVNQNVKKRKFVVSKDENQRAITQFQYVGWPDHGVPILCAPILKLRAAVREVTEPDTVILVHCSAGVGRTGTFMAVDDCLCEYNDTKMLNVKETLRRFRHFRDRTVQTDRQYVYVYHSVLEGLALPQTEIPKHQFVDRVNKYGVSEQEFEVLDILRGLDMEEECQGRVKENLNKNRFPDIIPADYNRAALTTEMKGMNLYLNACFMDNLSHSPSLVATQLPLEHTVVDLWRLVHDYSIHLLIRMDGDHVDDPKELYWPLKGTMTPTPFTIEFQSREPVHKDYSLETFALTYENHTRSVHMLVFHGWPGPASTLPPVQAMINLYHALKHYQAQAKETVIVQCFNGATKSGLLGATYSVLEALQVEETINVFKATRIIHTTRPQFIPDMEQYSFLHSLVCHFLQSPPSEEECIYENQLSVAEYEDDTVLYENLPRKNTPSES